MKSIRSNIGEGYGRRRYKQEFIHFLTYAQASCDETTDHLEMLFETGSLVDEPLFKDLSRRLDELGRKINLFTQAVEANHRTGAAKVFEYPASSVRHPATSVQP